jgi:hypothetical protein
MADLVAADVTYTEVAGSARKSGGTKSQMYRQFDVAFGDGAKTYPSGGVPLTAAKLGCAVEVTSLKQIGRTVTAAGTNYVWEWDKNQTAPKLKGFQIDRGAPTAGLTSGVELVAATTAPVLQTLRVEVLGY